MEGVFFEGGEVCSKKRKIKSVEIKVDDIQ